MPTIITRGAGSAQGLGYAAKSTDANFIEDVFSTYLYTGNGSTQTITNGIDLSGKGGLVWTKSRSNVINHGLIDTARGVGKLLYINSGAEGSGFNDAITSFNSTGYSLGADAASWTVNKSAYTYCSWTFRKQPKFFDIVTYTGNGTAGLTVSHSLGSAPGFIVVKRTDAAGAWTCFHTSLGGTKAVFLNATNAALTNIRYWNDTAPTSTVFTLGFDTDVNASGGTYVAYLFAHNAGGFGLTGTDNVISCGSFTPDGSGNATVNLGYEPQWVLWKYSTAVEPWYIFDNMRGWTASNTMADLRPNTAAAEIQNNSFFIPTATGFSAPATLAPSSPIIYIAIRRGPMKVPTSGTSVFEPIAYTGTGANNRQIGASTFVVDYILGTKRNTVDGKYFYTRLQGNGAYLSSTNTNAEAGAGSTLYGPQYGKIQLGYQQGSNDSLNLDNSGDTFINYLFRRAPGFFDEVCYTGTGVARTVAHNLAAVPELMIVKSRSTSARSWIVYAQALGATKGLYLEEPDAAVVNSLFWNNTAPTSSVFTVNTNASVNGSGSTFVAYLFASVPGVSKVGSYTGTGTTQVINCGFTAGARFVLIKRTDAAGDWYVWDSARGIVAGNDPYLLLNSTAAEVTGTDYVDTAASGFEISSTAPAAINANGGSFIFLAIA